MKFGINSFAWESPFGRDAYAQFKKAKDMGFDLYEIAPEDLELIDIPAIQDAIKKTGIEVATLCGAFGTTRDIASDHAEYRDNGMWYMRYLVDLAEAIGAKVIVGPMYCGIGNPHMKTEEEKARERSYAVENLKLSADYAAQKGVKLGIEPVNRFEVDEINTAAQALELVDQVGKDNVGLLLDTFHMNIEETSIIEAIRSAKGKLFSFHTCANNRGTPGEDNFDWEAIFGALKEIGYDDYCIIESFTPDCIEIAKAASVWRNFAPSPEYLAENGLHFLQGIYHKVY